MNMVTSAIPVAFINPYNCLIEVMPIEMIGAYFPNGTVLCLEQAARVACIRDEEAAANLLESITEPYSVSIFESVEEPSAQPEAVR
jgi:hypothetical protein